MILIEAFPTPGVITMTNYLNQRRRRCRHQQQTILTMKPMIDHALTAPFLLGFFPVTTHAFVLNVLGVINIYVKFRPAVASHAAISPSDNAPVAFSGGLLPGLPFFLCELVYMFFFSIKLHVHISILFVLKRF